MANPRAANKSTPFYQPTDSVPLPPKNADVMTTACDYCIVACGYKVYRWPSNSPNGGPKKGQNALNRDYTLRPLQGNWVGPNQVTQAVHNGQLHNIAIVADGDATVVNPGGGHSVRGGCIAQKVYNPKRQTHDRLKHPMIRVNDILMPVTWDFALDVMAEVTKHVIKKHGEHAWALKYYSYQYYENTYALTRFAFKSVNTPSVAQHDHPSIVNSVPGWVDIGYDIFSASYSDFSAADTILCSGTDPFESKTVVWNEWFLKGIGKNKTKVIMVNPRKTAGCAYVEKHGGLYIQITPGGDTALHLAITRVIIENDWHDKEFIKNWVANGWETDSGFGQGTRNTPWQWRTTWGKFQVKGFEGSKKHFKEWLFAQKESDPKVAAEICGIPEAQIHKAAEMMAKPVNGKRPKTSVVIEKGNYWSNNYLNTASIGTLAVICGAGGLEGKVVTRLGGHQRGGRGGGPYPGTKSGYKVPGRRRHRIDLDRWVTSGNVRYVWVVGTTWIQAMAGSSGLEDSFNKLTRRNPHQVRSLDKQTIINTLKRRADSGGMVVVNQDIYLIDPIGSKYADIVLPAATWGEEDFTRENGERRIRLYSKFYDAPGEALPDWKIVKLYAKKMGFEGYDWNESNDVFEEACRFSRGHRTDFNAIKVLAKAKGIKAHELLRSRGTTGYQCPLLWYDGKIVETKRQHDYKRKLPDTGPQGPTVTKKNILAFKTQTGKLNLVKSPWNLWSDFYDFMKPKGDELWITNGRINEVWQSGFDDMERRAYIQQRWPANFLEIHPDDAKSRGIESGDMIIVENNRVPIQTDFNLGVKDGDMWFSGLMKKGHIAIGSGQFSAVAIVTPDIKKGVAFTYFLKKDSPANTIVPRVPDPITQNYRFKISVGKVTKAGESVFKNTFAQMSFKRRGIT